MEKTAMQELIKFMSNEIYNESEEARKCEFRIRTKARELLELEKKQIIEAFRKGSDIDYLETAEYYYKSTFTPNN